MPESHHYRSESYEFPQFSGPNLPESGADGTPARLSRGGAAASRLPALAAAVVVLALLAGMVVFGVLMFRDPPAAATLRDIFLIILGVQSIIIGLLLVALLVAVVYVALKVYDLVNLVQNDIKPILHRADDTVRTVQSRTVFISDSAVKPIIEVMAYVSAAKSIIRSFTRSTH